jgi:hypothetical protein
MGYHADGNLTITYEESFFDSIEKKVFLDWLTKNSATHPDESTNSSDSWIQYICGEVGGYEENDTRVNSKGITEVSLYYGGKWGDWAESPINLLSTLGFGIEAQFTGEDHAGWSYSNKYGAKKLPEQDSVVQINSGELDELRVKVAKYNSVVKALAEDPERTWTSKSLGVYLKLEEFAKA